MHTHLQRFFFNCARKIGMMTVIFLVTYNTKAQCTFNNFTVVSTPVPNSMFTGMLVHLPDDYYSASTSTSTYPVIFTFGGDLSAGNGSPSDLCKLLTDQVNDLPGRIMRGEVPMINGATVGGITYKFIVVAAQFQEYNYPTHYPQANDVDALLNYISQNYRIDISRIYLTGISAGANLALQYPASSVAHALRVAAVSVLSTCTVLSMAPNNPSDPGHIASAHLPVWFAHCPQDGTAGGTGAECNISTPQGWVNAINASTPAPNPAPAFTQFAPNNDAAFPRPLTNCRPWPHDTWTSAYDQNFQPAALGGTQNVYQWFLSNSRPPTALPVTLKNFTARLQSGKVYLRWTVATENKNAYFTLERSSNDQQFISIAAIAGQGTSPHEKVYEYVDDKPLSNLSFYRLAQTDDNNKKTYFEVRKILNRSGIIKLITASPNPFKNELSAFVHVDRPQRVTISITDMNGKKLMSTQSIFTEGTTTINLDIAALPSGIYFLKAAGESVTETNKIIKQ